jgi:4-hydroxy-tetrahydrodipicolinate synthase
VVVYNVPSRTGTNVDADTFLRLATHPRIVAVKEASGNLEQVARICSERPRDVAVLSGDDAWTLPILALGGNGVISVASNEIPGEMVALCAAARDGDWEGARRIHERWLPLMLANFRGAPNPVPVKAALDLMGLASDAVRRPLLSLDDSARERLALLLRSLGLLELPGGRSAREMAVPVEGAA